MKTKPPFGQDIDLSVTLVNGVLQTWFYLPVLMHPLYKLALLLTVLLIIGATCNNTCIFKFRTVYSCLIHRYLSDLMKDIF